MTPLNRSQITALAFRTDDEPLAVGEGITRTSAPASRLIPVQVVFFTGGRPMVNTIRATSDAQALQFALARHPAADPSRTKVLTQEQAAALLQLRPQRGVPHG